VDESTIYPIRLHVIDGNGAPVAVDMYKEGEHYLFIPVAANGRAKFQILSLKNHVSLLESCVNSMTKFNFST
jgi:hypothetical protein